jgi:hypothetical protein
LPISAPPRFLWDRRINLSGKRRMCENVKSPEQCRTQTTQLRAMYHISLISSM